MTFRVSTFRVRLAGLAPALQGQGEPYRLLIIYVCINLTMSRPDGERARVFPALVCVRSCDGGAVKLLGV